MIRQERNGFTLISMIVALCLLSVFLLVSTHLINTTFRATRMSEASQTRAIRFDGMMELMRRDAWSASAIRPAEGGVTLEQGSEGRVIWRVDAEGAVQRSVEPVTPGNGAQQWAGLGAEISLSPRPGVLAVRVRDNATHRIEEMVLPSEVLKLAKGMR